jgi:hypothetical protein
MRVVLSTAGIRRLFARADIEGFGGNGKGKNVRDLTTAGRCLERNVSLVFPDNCLLKEVDS